MLYKFGQGIPQSLIDAVANITETKHDEPAKPDADAIARKKKLDALRDKREADAAEHGYEKEKSPVRKVAGKAYGGAAQKDEPEQHDEAYKNSSDGTYHNPHKDVAKEFKKNPVPANKPAKVKTEEVEQIDEKSVSKAQQKFMGMVYKAKKGGDRKSTRLNSSH